MTPARKLAAFALVLAAALGGGAAVGRAVGPIDDTDDKPPMVHDQHGHDTGSTTTMPGHTGHEGHS
jgi:hypothetical protein